MAAAAGGLRALGVRPGDTVALLSANRPELWVADLAVTMCGATTCPLYTTLPPNDVEFVVGDAGARSAGRPRAARPGATRTRGRARVVRPARDRGRARWTRGEPVDLAAAAAALDPRRDHHADLHVGDHRAAEGRRAHARRRRWPRSRGWDGSHDSLDVRRIISWLPTAHVMDRVLHYSMALAKGYETTTCPDPREIARLPDRGAAAPADRRRRACGRSSRRASRRRWRRCRPSAATPPGRRSRPARQRVRLREAGDAGAARARRRAWQRADAALFAGLRERLGLDQLDRWPASAPRRSRATCSSSSTRSASNCCQGYALSEAGCLGAVGRRRRHVARHRRPPACRASSSGSPTTARSSCAARR